MDMKALIEGFPAQVQKAIEIADNAELVDSGKEVDKVLITGLGGSGIGGKIVSDIIRDVGRTPIYLNNGYTLPGFVDDRTLVIVSSYSGNTEETLSAMMEAQSRNAEIACITSGGKVKVLAEEHGHNVILVPGGDPPRACLGYSLVQQFRLLHFYDISPDGYRDKILSGVELIEQEAANIRTMAKAIAEKLVGKTPVLYAEKGYDGVVIRLRQQLNENAKTLCWHHVVPEMNHNELVGWGGGKDEYEVLMFLADDDHPRNKVRMALSKEIISKKTNVTEIKALGNNKVERAIYLINLGDWISWYLSELKGVDAIEIAVIDYLKGELGKL